jgi:Tol biopolymer transport system component
MRVRMIAAAVAAAAALVAAAPAGATPPGANGDIFYTGVYPGVPQLTGIWRVHPDGFGTSQLPLGADATRPRVSPDGTRLLFAVNGSSSDFLANVDGSGVQQMPFSGGAWYPDGTRVVFARRGRGSSSHLFRERLDGSRPARLTRGHFADSAPAVSPDGRQIAFSRNGLLLRMPADGGAAERVGTDTISGGPDWSPDSSHLAYVCVQPPGNVFDLCVINADGSGRRVIWPPQGLACSVSDPSWSPDGTQIAFAVVCESGEHAIWTSNTAGTLAELVTDFPDLASQPSWQRLGG